jgi:hypothetical protein
MRFRPACFLLSLLVFVSAAVAQDPPRRDPQALVVLQHAAASMGVARLASVQDSVVEATASLPGRQPEGTITIKTKGNDRMRWDGTKGGETNSEVVSRGRPSRSTREGWRSGPSANSQHRRPDHLPALLLTHELPRAEVSLTYVGLEEVEGRQTYHVRVARVSNLGNPVDEQITKNSELDLFIDAQTFLVLKVYYIHLSETDWRRGVPMEIYYGDYRNVDGVLVPFHQRKVFNGTTISEIRITSVRFNVGLADTDFEVR